MSSYRKYKEQIVATNKARRQAIKTLISQHQEEFDILYQYEATKLGLNTTKVNARIARTRSGQENAD
jgi:hypothetical protein